MLVEQQVERIKLEKLLKSGRKEEEIIREACKAIEEQIVQNHAENNSSRRKISLVSTENTRYSHNKYNMLRRDHRRSVTESVYEIELT